MLLLVPLAAALFSLLFRSGFVLPEDRLGWTLAASAVTASACGLSLRRILRRARPLRWGGRTLVFSAAFLLWLAALFPALTILNVELDPSARHGRGRGAFGFRWEREGS